MELLRRDLLPARADRDYNPGRPDSLLTSSKLLREHEIQFRVRYPETDPGGVAHHAHYFTWFEMGRTELLRASGATNYREMEAAGYFVVVVRVQCRYHKPARYDDLLRLKTTVTRVTTVAIEHDYHLYRDDELLAEAHVVMCCVDRQGEPQRLPDWARLQARSASE